jgi:hypothetical protein
MMEPPGLDRIAADYQHAKERLAEIGFTCEGSLALRYRACGNPNCRCTDPEHRHGPYWQLSWKHAGTTISRNLPADDVALYQEWIANRRALDTILAEMRDLSHQAATQILTGRGRSLLGPDRPRRRAA